MRFIRRRRPSRPAAPEPSARPDGLPVTDPALPARLTAAFTASPRLRRRRSVVVDTLTLGEVAGYFSGHRPDDPRARTSALLTTTHPGGRMVFQIFLDDKDRVCADQSGTPYGRQVIARRLDDELLDYLGGSGLLIFR